MATTQKMITFPEPLRAWVETVAKARGIPFATAATQLLQAAKEAAESSK